MMFEKTINSIMLAKLILNEYTALSEDKKTLTNIVLFCEHYNRLSEEKFYSQKTGQN